MTQEDKNLLLKDLCGRLPYGVKIALKNSESYHHENVAKKGDVTIDKLKGFTGSYFSIYHDNPLDWDWYENDIDIEDIKPYLFPMSSMTEEQRKEYEWIIYRNIELHCARYYDVIDIDEFDCLMDFYHKYHFDYRGLIKKGLAVDATGLNIY